jgi:hypothetical protein
MMNVGREKKQLAAVHVVVVVRMTHVKKTEFCQNFKEQVAVTARSEIQCMIRFYIISIVNQRICKRKREKNR